MMITFAIVAAVLTTGLIFILVGNNNNVSGQELNSTKQIEEYFKQQVEDLFQKEFNITGIESEQERRIKIFLTLCNNPEKQKTWFEIEPEVCDVGMKGLRDRGLIE